MRRSVPVAAVLAALAIVTASPVSTPAAPPTSCQQVTLHPNPNALPNGQVGQAYSERIWMTPSNPCIPALWSVSPNPPFPGVTLSPGPGADEAFLIGTPTTTGAYTFTISSGGIIDCGAICWLSQTYTIQVF